MSRVNEALIPLARDRSAYEAVRGHVAARAAERDRAAAEAARAALLNPDRRGNALVILGEARAYASLLEEIDALRGD
jgi:hypothetical protein